MPNSQLDLDLTKVGVEESFDYTLTPGTMVEDFKCVDDYILKNTLNFIQPNQNLQSRRSVIEGVLEALSHHQTMIDGAGKIVLKCEPGQVYILFVAISAIIASPLIDVARKPKMRVLQSALRSQAEKHGFLASEEISET